MWVLIKREEMSLSAKLVRFWWDLWLLFLTELRKQHESQRHVRLITWLRFLVISEYCNKSLLTYNPKLNEGRIFFLSCRVPGRGESKCKLVIQRSKRSLLASFCESSHTLGPRYHYTTKHIPCVLPFTSLVLLSMNPVCMVTMNATLWHTATWRMSGCYLMQISGN